MRKLLILIAAVALLGGCAASAQKTVVSPGSLNSNIINSSTNQPNSMVKITTNLGDITMELFANDAPKTVENFLTLTKKGFYDGVVFHRVISGFMIQGGDPTGTGSGGPGYAFADELNANTESYKTGYVRGTLAMANAGPDTNGSQFFIMHQDYPLPHAYTIFGRVTEGMETVDQIAASKTDANDRPLSKVTIEKVEVLQ
jgi:cyclophilin family peptidyl-prolyl cis-trans isomerase